VSEGEFRGTRWLERIKAILRKPAPRPSSCGSPPWDLSVVGQCLHYKTAGGGYRRGVIGPEAYRRFDLITDQPHQAGC